MPALEWSAFGTRTCLVASFDNMAAAQNTWSARPPVKEDISKLHKSVALTSYLQVEFLDPAVGCRRHISLVLMLRTGGMNKLGRVAIGT